jgi:glycosyltransferase involved in cell wall biosynthesis
MYKVDVIIPNYSETLKLKRAIDSVLNQNSVKTVIFVVDNGHSTEVSEYISSELESMAGKIKHVKLNDPRHPGFARHQGLMRGFNPWVAFLDSDDWWEPDHLISSINFALNGNYDLVSSDAFVHLNESDNPEPLSYFRGRQPKWNWSYIFRNPNINSSIVFRRRLLEKVGDYPSSHMIRGVEDFAFILRACTFGTSRRRSEASVHYSRSSQSLSASTASYAKVAAYLDFLTWLNFAKKTKKFKMMAVRSLVIFQIVKESINT